MSALATGNAVGVGWSAATALAVVAAVVLARVRFVCQAFVASLAGTTTILTAVTLMSRRAPWSVHSGERMALFRGNPNLLGASLMSRLGCSLLIGAVFSLVPRQGLLRLSPLLAGLALVNTWDITLVAPAAFVPTLLAVAYWTSAEPSRHTEPSSRP